MRKIRGIKGSDATAHEVTHGYSGQNMQHLAVLLQTLTVKVHHFLMWEIRMELYLKSTAEATDETVETSVAGGLGRGGSSPHLWRERGCGNWADDHKPSFGSSWMLKVHCNQDNTVVRCINLQPAVQYPASCKSWFFCTAATHRGYAQPLHGLWYLYLCIVVCIAL